MKTLKKSLLTLLTVLICLNHPSAKAESQQTENSKKIIVAYVVSNKQILPDPTYMTHINYAFGNVNQTFDGVQIDNEPRLRQISALKKDYPHLKVMLSIGGWGSGRFSEMAETDATRKSFAKDCQRIVKEFNLDGIDMDWEYPTTSFANISSSQDTENFTLLIKEIRAAIGKDKLLTMASVASARYVDFKAINPYMDFINIMSYDMGTPPFLHCALYQSERVRRFSAHDAVKAHIEAGIPASKLVLGMPFYGRGGKSISNFINYIDIEKLPDTYKRNWDADAEVPYITDEEGDLVCTYDNPESLTIKCQYILNHNLLGAMYWEYTCDNEAGDLRRTVYETLNQ